jgi:CMP-N-acetylneuraminic acid synthetase
MVKTIALIPARGGSKGIPRKNLAPVAGRPLIAHTIQAARDARSIDVIYLSSDDDEILALGASMGCRPVKRPAELAADQSKAADVVAHLIETVLGKASDDTALVYLQPTSPFRTAVHIDEAVALMRLSETGAVVSVVEMDKSPFKSFVLDDQGNLRSLFEESLSNANRQALPPAYIPNGAIYGFRLGTFRDRAAFPSNGSRPYVMSRQHSIDVDTPDDLAIVRALMESNNG